MNTQYRRSAAILCTSILFSASVFAGFFDSIKSVGKDVMDNPSSVLSGTSVGNAATSSLSESQIGSGLKEALAVGAKRAVKLLSENGGFLNDQSVRIPLPGILEKAGKTLRALGQDKYVDAFETTVNQAAEQAIPKTLTLVEETVKTMTLEDVRGILSGGDDAATQFLKQRTSESLHKAVLPIVAEATDNAGATSAYKNLQSQAGSSLGSFSSLLGGDSKALDLDDYVTTKTLDGLFLKLAAEEKAIRENPIARSTELLKTVFGQ